MCMVVCSRQDSGRVACKRKAVTGGTTLTGAIESLPSRVPIGLVGGNRWAVAAASSVRGVRPECRVPRAAVAQWRRDVCGSSAFFVISFMHSFPLSVLTAACVLAEIFPTQGEGL